jgi:hypothetical protein
MSKSTGLVTMPWCAVCQRPVDELELRYQQKRPTIYIARCHGAEQSFCDRAALASDVSLTFGEAFAAATTLSSENSE